MAVSDLTGTKWEINSTTCSAGYGEFDITGTYGDPVESGIDFIKIGYVMIFPGQQSLRGGSGLEPNPFYAPNDDTILINGNPTYLFVGDIIEITGGTDATNSDLIAWLEANATQVASANNYDLSYNLTNLTNGNISLTFAADTGYELPSSITVSSGTLVSWNQSTGVAVISGYSNNTSVSVECEELNPYLTFSSPNSFTLNVADNQKYWDGTLEYSTNTETWSIWDGTTTLSSASDGTKYNLYLRGAGNTYITGESVYDNPNKGYWILTGSNINCSGYIENLLDYQTVANGNEPIMATCCFYGLFYNNISLLSSPNFKNTTLSIGCYGSMFSHCTGLTTAPELPATTLAIQCYENMFNSCTSLTTAPALPATTLAEGCYYNMFYDCTSLTSAPTLPATTLPQQCYAAMFCSCTSLATAPALPATTLAKECYQGMFMDCTSLISAPSLPATTLADFCYQYMFSRCTSLTSSPELPATTLAVRCYDQMFSGCTSLITAPTLPATTLTLACYENMFSNCTALTIVPNLPATTLARYCYSHMFEGCTSLTTPPELSATTLAERCYEYMFSACAGLTAAPELPVTILASDCYNSMFSGCTSLTTTPILPAMTLAQGCYKSMFSGCTSLITPAIMAGGTTQAVVAKYCCQYMYENCTSLNIYTSSSGHTAFYKALTYSTSSSASNYYSTYAMFRNCYIDGTKSTATYLTAGTQYYY